MNPMRSAFAKKQNQGNGGKTYRFQLDDRGSQAALQDSLKILGGRWSGSCLARAALRAIHARLVAGEIEQVEKEMERAR